MRRFAILFCIALLLLTAISFRTTQAQDILTCRSGDVHILKGKGPPQTAVLLLFDTVPVGGSTTDVQGNYQVQLRVGPEAPGDYRVEVQVRGSHQTLQTALCRVPGPDATDGPAAPAQAATTSATGAANAPTATRSATATQGRVTVTSTARTGGTATTTATASATGQTATASPSTTATNQGGATSTPSATGQATNTSSPTVTRSPTIGTPTSSSIDLTLDIDDDEPAVDDRVLTSGDVTDANGDGINNASVSVAYSFPGNQGQWCSDSTDSDGYWECEGTVTAAMNGKTVTLTAKVTINGQTRTEVTTITPGA